MKTTKFLFAVLTLFIIVTIVGCKSHSAYPNLTDNLRKSLDQAGLKDVTVNYDSDKGIVTLGGQVVSDDQKAQAESLAKNLDNTDVIANQIAVVPQGQSHDAKAMNSDIDSGIEKNLDAALIQNQMHDHVKYDVKNGVVTLKGKVKSEALRAQAEQIAKAVPNVQQVVNTLQVKDQKASSSM